MDRDVETVDLERWVERWTALLGEDPLPPGSLDALQRRLGHRLPAAFGVVSTVFAGGLVGDLDLLDFDPAGPRPSLLTRTVELRELGLIGPCDVVIAEPDESIIVWKDVATDGPVLWLHPHDVERVLIRHEPPLSDTDEWPDLGTFLEGCLADHDDEDES
jgi:hypothetical protein